jgi:copper homeostasis protein
MPLLLEVIVQSVADARAAAAGGADRLEVVRAIEQRGLTPPLDLVRAIASETRLPLRVMVRECDGFSLSDPRELARLQRAIAAFAELAVDGAVVGYARGAELDLETTQAVLSAAPALPVTFHHAFDEARDPAAAIESLRRLPQVDRILTAGGGGDWSARCRRLERYAQYAAQAGAPLAILAGGGVDAAGLQALASSGCVREAHVGRAAREPQEPTARVSADRVRHLKSLIPNP